MIKPKPLKMGDTLGIVGPASPTDPEKIPRIKKGIEDLGFNVMMGESCYASYGYLSGKDDVRAKDINKMFIDERVDGILCIRGGYGSPRILDQLDYKLIKKHPKVFIGYSDITGLHLAMNRHSHLVTFHGPMASSMGRDLDAFTKDALLRSIMAPQPMGSVKNPIGNDMLGLVKGACTGDLIGGNLALIAATLGTPYEIDTKGKILFIEDVGEEPYRIDRMLTQLRLAGKLKDAKGFVLGSWKDCVAEEPEKSLTLMDVFNDIIVPLGKPTLYNVMAGHCDPMITLPFGVKAVLNSNEGTLTLVEAATKK